MVSVGGCHLSVCWRVGVGQFTVKNRYGPVTVALSVCLLACGRRSIHREHTIFVFV